jgi:diadenosine tetraphosphate (Ap4A) HIT family hydrolase
MTDCLICNRIKQIKQGTNPYFVAELETSYVVVGDHQFFKGYTLFLCKQHVPELHQLEKDFKLKFLDEMSLVAESVFKIFQPKILNYEALGNAEPHLHWHLFPRYKDDPNPEGTIWQIDRSLRYSDNYIARDSGLKEHKQSLSKELTRFTELIVLSKFN